MTIAQSITIVGTFLGTVVLILKFIDRKPDDEVIRTENVLNSFIQSTNLKLQHISDKIDSLHKFKDGAHKMVIESEHLFDDFKAHTNALFDELKRIRK